MYTLATLDQLRSRLGLAPGDKADEARLWRALTAASARIEMTSGRHFTPRLATLAHDLRDPRELTLADDLLQLQRLSNGDGRDVDLARGADPARSDGGQRQRAAPERGAALRLVGLAPGSHPGDGHLGLARALVAGLAERR